MWMTEMVEEGLMITDERGKTRGAEKEKVESMILGILGTETILIETEGEKKEDQEDMTIMIPGTLTEEITTMILTAERTHNFNFCFLTTVKVLLI